MSQSDWAEQNWRGSNFGDKRLVNRAIEIAKQSLQHSEESLPGKFQDWAGLKGAYRFFSSEKVSHEKVQEVHNQNVIREAAVGQ